MRCGFFIIFVVCHVNLLIALLGVCAKDAIHDNDDTNSNYITNNGPVSIGDTQPTESSSDANSNYEKLPTILIVTLFRNKAHTMPYFFTYLNRIDYPKQRISLW